MIHTRYNKYEMLDARIYLDHISHITYHVPVYHVKPMDLSKNSQFQVDRNIDSHKTRAHATKATYLH